MLFQIGMHVPKTNRVNNKQHWIFRVLTQSRPAIKPCVRCHSSRSVEDAKYRRRNTNRTEQLRQRDDRPFSRNEIHNVEM